MNIKDIKSLIQLMENSSLTLLEVSENDMKIRLQRTLHKEEILIWTRGLFLGLEFARGMCAGAP